MVADGTVSRKSLMISVLTFDRRLISLIRVCVRVSSNNSWRLVVARQTVR